MSNAPNVALSFLLAQSAIETAQHEASHPTFTVKVTKEKIAKAVKAKKSNGSQAAPIHNEGKVTVTGLALPDVGSLTAHDFILAMRNAGKRMLEGKLVFQQAEMRDDQIKAIAGFIGYDNRIDFGSQDQAARAQAMRVIRGPIDSSKVLSREEQHKADLSAKGFVAGLPAPVSAKLADLQGREVIAAEAMVTHEKDAQDPSRSEADRELSEGLAAVEQDRLQAIRRDIAALTF